MVELKQISSVLHDKSNSALSMTLAQKKKLADEIRDLWDTRWPLCSMETQAAITVTGL